MLDAETGMHSNAPVRPIIRRVRWRPCVVAGSLPRSRAQVLPSEPMAFGTRVADDRRRRLGHGRAAQACSGDGSRCTTDTGFFNYTDYEHSALRMLRVGMCRRGASRRPRLAARRGAQRERRPAGALRALRARPALARRAASTSRSDACRRPSAPSRGALPDRQPAHRLSARLPVPDVAPPRRAAGQRRRAAADARPRLALELLGRQPDARPRPAARAARSAGTPAFRCTPRSRRVGRDGRGHDRHARPIPLVGDDNDGRQVAGRVVAAAGRRPDRRRLGRARPVRDARDAAQARRRRPTTATSRRRPGAPTSSTRATTTSCAFEAIVSDWRLPRLLTPRSTGRCAPSSTSVEGRYKMRPGLYRGRAPRSPRLQRRSTGTDADRTVGRAGHARRGRRRLLAAAQPAPEAVVSAQHAATAARGSG